MFGKKNCRCIHVKRFFTDLIVHGSKEGFAAASLLFDKNDQNGSVKVESHLGHALLLLLCKGADNVGRLGEDMLGNLAHHVSHCVEVADHLVSI